MFYMRWSPSRQEWNKVCVPIPRELYQPAPERLALPTTERLMITDSVHPNHFQAPVPTYRLVQTPLGFQPLPCFPDIPPVPPVYNKPTYSDVVSGTSSQPRGPPPRLVYQSHPVYSVSFTPLGPQLDVHRSIDLLRTPQGGWSHPPTFCSATGFVYPPSWVEEAAAKYAALGDLSSPTTDSQQTPFPSPPPSGGGGGGGGGGDLPPAFGPLRADGGGPQSVYGGGGGVYGGGGDGAGGFGFGYGGGGGSAAAGSAGGSLAFGGGSTAS